MLLPERHALVIPRYDCIAILVSTERRSLWRSKIVKPHKINIECLIGKRPRQGEGDVSLMPMDCRNALYTLTALSELTRRRCGGGKGKRKWPGVVHLQQSMTGMMCRLPSDSLTIETWCPPCRPCGWDSIMWLPRSGKSILASHMCVYSLFSLSMEGVELVIGSIQRTLVWMDKSPGSSAACKFLNPPFSVPSSS